MRRNAWPFVPRPGRAGGRDPLASSQRVGGNGKPVGKLVLVGTIPPYLPASFLGGQGPSPIASATGDQDD